MSRHALFRVLIGLVFLAGLICSTAASAGSSKKRVLHALGHAFVAYREDGTRMPNISEWLGTTSAVALSNTYHPGNRRGFTPAARTVGWSVLQDMGFDLLREFWPEVARKLRLPFRDRNEPVGRDSSLIIK